MVYFNKSKFSKPTNNISNTLTIGGAIKSVNLEKQTLDKEKQKNIYIDNKISDDKLKKFVNLKLN